MAMIWKIKRWSPKNADNIEITTDGIIIPVTTEERLKVINLEKIILGSESLSAANVQILLKVKLEIMAISDAMALVSPFSKLMLEPGVINNDLNILAPMTLTAKPNKPMTPNFINFWVKSSNQRILKTTNNISMVACFSILDSPEVRTLNMRGTSLNLAPSLRVLKRS